MAGWHCAVLGAPTDDTCQLLCIPTSGSHRDGPSVHRNCCWNGVLRGWNVALQPGTSTGCGVSKTGTTLVKDCCGLGMKVLENEGNS